MRLLRRNKRKRMLRPVQMTWTKRSKMRQTKLTQIRMNKAEIE